VVAGIRILHKIMETHTHGPWRLSGKQLYRSKLLCFLLCILWEDYNSCGRWCSSASQIAGQVENRSPLILKPSVVIQPTHSHKPIAITSYTPSIISTLSLSLSLAVPHAWYLGIITSLYSPTPPQLVQHSAPFTLHPLAHPGKDIGMQGWVGSIYIWEISCFNNCTSVLQ
jgi:hypothetical protein